MTIVYRREKGCPLTADELDDNFRELDERLNEAEARAPSSLIHSIEVEGQKIVFLDQMNTIIATVPLPTMRFNSKGEWAKDNDYALNDLVTHEEAAYLCLKPHNAHKFNSKYWQKLIDLPGLDKKEEGKMLLDIHTPSHLPGEPEVGQLIGIIDQEEINPVYWSGSHWRYLSTNEIFEEIGDE